MATHFGTLKRDKPRLQFVKGYAGQSTAKDQEILHIWSNALIRSGMIISKFWNSSNSRYEWKIGMISGAVPYIAEEDYDDSSVLASGGKITGYPLSSEFVARTSYAYINSDTASWSDNAALSAVADATTGSGSLKLAASGEQIVGYLTGSHRAGLKDVAAENSNVTKDGDGKVLVAEFRANFSKGNLLA